jgi:hypothetical protein
LQKAMNSSNTVLPGAQSSSQSTRNYDESSVHNTAVAAGRRLRVDARGRPHVSSEQHGCYRAPDSHCCGARCACPRRQCC